MKYIRNSHEKLKCDFTCNSLEICMNFARSSCEVHPNFVCSSYEVSVKLWLWHFTWNSYEMSLQVHRNIHIQFRCRCKRVYGHVSATPTNPPGRPTIDKCKIIGGSCVCSSAKILWINASCQISWRIRFFSDTIWAFLFGRIFNWKRFINFRTGYSGQHTLFISKISWLDRAVIVCRKFKPT